ncbi:unnamed protein product [Chondrus crispus]|uniref:Secreted protein n=1 Tax=Chondrus crispus TaxID=2769 RepID=R7Q9Y0_CHOCR|nr:unnamed protein product [Chondrus crispus]CDF35337.1 unnamed protein product [Chondrus crispus]|eukprot:XP_005715156.1 unnamed protein product [Chondrus crispus]
MSRRIFCPSLHLLPKGIVLNFVLDAVCASVGTLTRTQGMSPLSNCSAKTEGDCVHVSTLYRRQPWWRQHRASATSLVQRRRSRPNGRGH